MPQSADDRLYEIVHERLRAAVDERRRWLRWRATENGHQPFTEVEERDLIRLSFKSDRIES